jgi:6-phosphogluconolactonase
MGKPAGGGMRVEVLPDAEAVAQRAAAIVAARYAAELHTVAGSPPELDLAHLGLGPDGHTASLVPGDAALQVADAEVAITETYQGRRRMTLTYPALDRARQLLWVVTGADKAAVLPRLRGADLSIPAGRVRADRALLLADAAAAALPTPY